MDERGGPDPLKELGDRIERARVRDSGTEPRSEPGPLGAALSLGLRIGVELVVSLAVGGGLGWLGDRWLGTTPWLLLAGLILGFGAGLMSVYRVMSGAGMAVGYFGVDKGRTRPAEDESDED